ncbi:MAG: class I SAM-dependent methyltransferase [Chitinophagales bacterium]
MSAKWKLAQWLELRWWRRYLGPKNKADYYHWKRNYWNALLHQIGEPWYPGPQQHIVDFGCGPAGIFIAFPKHQVTAVDPLLDAYSQQLTMFQPTDFPNVNFINSTLEDASLPRVYDVAYCMNAINHVRDMEVAMANLVRTVRKKGIVVVSIDAHRNGLFKYLFRMIPGDALHPHQCDEAEYRALLERHGIKIEKSMETERNFFFRHVVLVGSVD